MYFYKNLYVGSSIRDPEMVMKNLRTGRGQFTVYVIALSPSKPGIGANQLEILHCVNLKQPYYKEYPPYIVGIASGRMEAIELVRDMVQEAYDHTGSADVRAYLFPHGIRPVRAKELALRISASPETAPAVTETEPDPEETAPAASEITSDTAETAPLE